MGALEAFLKKIVNTGECIVENFIGGFIGQILGQISTVVNGILTGITGAFSKVKNLAGGVEDLISAIGDTLANFLSIDFTLASFFGGTSLLIIVGVALDTLQQIESHLLVRHYDGFLKSGKIKGRRRF